MTIETVSPGTTSSGGGNGPPAAPEQFVIDPFAADINPGTTRGQKLFIEACTPLEDAKKISASVETAHTVIRRITGLAQKIRWGTQVVAVKLQYDLTETKSLLTENHDLTIDDFKLQAYKIWGGGNELDTFIPVSSTTGREEMELVEISITPTSSDDEKKIFFARVRSTMIRHAVEGFFDDKTLEVIRLQRTDYEWRCPTTGIIEEDGATMLKVFFDFIKPNVRVGLKEHKRIIQRASAKKYSNNPVDMLNAMDGAYDEITVNHGKPYDDYIENIFEALKTCPNKIFTDYVVRLEDDYESISKSGATNKEIREVVTKVKNKYKNMKSGEKWDYVDPSEAKIMALTTSLDEVKMQLAEEQAKNNSKKKVNTFDSRRTEHVGTSTTIDGVEYVWCDKGHKSRASPNGMYMPKGHDHVKWEEAKKARKNNQTSSGNDSSSNREPQKKMVLSEKMKTVLMTKAGFSDEDADEMLKEALNQRARDKGVFIGHGNFSCIQ